MHTVIAGCMAVIARSQVQRFHFHGIVIANVMYNVPCKMSHVLIVGATFNCMLLGFHLSRETANVKIGQLSTHRGNSAKLLKVSCFPW